MHSVIETDALIIGAGPCGLFQAFELGLLGVSCQLLEALPHPGGQCAELYPDKPIYDIPGIPHSRADQLTAQLLQQLAPFNTPMHYNQIAQHIALRPDQRYQVDTPDRQFIAANVVIAAGVGAFSAVRLKTPGIDKFEHTQLFYTQPPATDGAQVLVCGDSQQAVARALSLTQTAASVTLLHRTRRLALDEATASQLQRAEAAGKLSRIKGKISSFSETADQRLSSVDIQLKRDESCRQPVDIILPLLGTSPKLVPLEQWGLAASASRIDVDPAHFESASPGLFAVGDINQYPGKRKLILCGFHEATLAAFAIANRLQPDKPVHLQYTTTSTELKARLGVA